MLRVFFFLLASSILAPHSKSWAQYESINHVGEYGIQFGVSQYVGDLNLKVMANTPKLAVSTFFQKQLNNYVGVKLSAAYTRLGASDQNSNEKNQQLRNLSFNSDLWEFTLQGQFNFFKFQPYDPNHRWTPYLTGGLGVFFFNPFAFLQGKKYFLQPLGTEGQNRADLFPDRKPYTLSALCFPIGAGVKFNVSNNVNIGFEAVYRFTNTDYIDDVSTTYAGAAAFTPNTPAAALQDRSTEFSPPIGTAGFQRGNSTKKDGYFFLQGIVSFNIASYRCPKASK